MTVRFRFPKPGRPEGPEASDRRNALPAEWLGQQFSCHRNIIHDGLKVAVTLRHRS